MVLSLFKQKPIISVLLLKDSCSKNKKNEKKPQISYLESRLHRLESKLKKVKRHSKTVFKRYEINSSAELKCNAGGKIRKNKIKKRITSSCDDTNESDTCDKEDAVCGDSSSNKNSTIELECSRMGNLTCTQEAPEVIHKKEENICMQEKNICIKEKECKDKGQSSETDTKNCSDEVTSENQVNKDDSYLQMKESRKREKCAAKCDRKELKRKQKVERKCQKYKQMVAKTCEDGTEGCAISGVEESEVSDFSTKDLSKLLELKTKNMLTRKERSLSDVLRNCYEKYVCDSKSSMKNDISGQKDLSNNNKTSTTCIVEMKCKEKLPVSDSESNNAHVVELSNILRENDQEAHLQKPCAEKSIQNFTSKQRVISDNRVKSQQSAEIAVEEIISKNMGIQNKETINASSPVHSCHRLFNNTINNQEDEKNEQDNNINKKASSIYIIHKMSNQSQNQNNMSNPSELRKSDKSKSIQSMTESTCKDKKNGSLLKTSESKANACSKISLHHHNTKSQVLASASYISNADTQSKTKDTSYELNIGDCVTNQTVKMDSLESMRVKHSSDNKMSVNNISSKSVSFPERNEGVSQENHLDSLNDPIQISKTKSVGSLNKNISCQHDSSEPSHTKIIENPKFSKTETVDSKDNCKLTSKQSIIKSKGTKTGMNSESVVNSNLFIYHHETSSSKHLKKKEPSFDKAVRRDESRCSSNQSTNLFSSDKVTFTTKSNISHLSEIRQPKGSFTLNIEPHKNIVITDKNSLDGSCKSSNHAATKEPASEITIFNKIENIDSNLLNNSEKSLTRSISMGVPEKSNLMQKSLDQEENKDMFNSNQVSKKSGFSIHHLSSEIKTNNECLEKNELDQSDLIKTFQTSNVNEQSNKDNDSSSIEQLVQESQKENSDDVLNKLSDESSGSIESVKTLCESNSLDAQIIDQLTLSNDKTVLVNIKSEISTQTPLWEKLSEVTAEIVNNEKQQTEMISSNTSSLEHDVTAKSQISTQSQSNILEPDPLIKSEVDVISSSTNSEQVITVNRLQKDIKEKSLISGNDKNLILEDLKYNNSNHANSSKQVIDATQTDLTSIKSSIVLNDTKHEVSDISTKDVSKLLTLKDKKTDKFFSQGKISYQEMTKRSLYSLPNFTMAKENNKQIELSTKILEDSKLNKKIINMVPESEIITEPKKNNDYLVIHCKKCSEISIAKIIEKKNAGSNETEK